MKKRVYKGDVLFKTFHSWGAAASNKKLMEFSQREFGRHSQMGPFYAMWHWAFQNAEEAFPIWKEWYFEKYPEVEQPTFEDFLIHLRDMGLRSQTIGGSREKVELFCAKYGLDMDYKVSPQDVVQVTSRRHPLYQSLMIVDGVVDDGVTAFLINSDGTRSEHSLRFKEFGVLAKAVDGRRRGLFVKDLTKIPKLEAMSKEFGTPLREIEFGYIEGVERGYLFIYITREIDEETGGHKQIRFFYENIDDGLDREIERFKNMLTESVVGELATTVV